jgi:DNA-binding NtrC family response regulator
MVMVGRRKPQRAWLSAKGFGSTREYLMKPTLLIAEGDAELRDVFRRLFTQRGYEVETASDGLDCLVKLRRQVPVMLVLDQELRWGGGVLAWLRQEGATSGVPVVLTATAGCPPHGTEDIDPPVVKFLPKPFTLTALLESVRAAVAYDAGKESPNLQDAAACSEHFIG